MSTQLDLSSSRIKGKGASVIYDNKVINKTSISTIRWTEATLSVLLLFLVSILTTLLCESVKIKQVWEANTALLQKNKTKLVPLRKEIKLYPAGKPLIWELEL